MTREAAFLKLVEHPMLGRQIKKLNNFELGLACGILYETESLNDDDFASKVLRLWLDNDNKPKNWVIIEELLIASMVLKKKPYSIGATVGSK